MEFDEKRVFFAGLEGLGDEDAGGEGVVPDVLVGCGMDVESVKAG